MRCYVCETENNFLCTQESNCTRGSRFCTTVAVSRYPFHLGFQGLLTRTRSGLRVGLVSLSGE